MKLKSPKWIQSDKLNKQFPNLFLCLSILISLDEIKITQVGSIKIGMLMNERLSGLQALKQ